MKGIFSRMRERGGARGAAANGLVRRVGPGPLLLGASLIGAAVYLQHQSSSRPDYSAQIAGAQARIAAAAVDKAQAEQQPQLPTLRDTWERVSRAFTFCGLNITVINADGSAPQSGSALYVGPQAAWHGAVEGPKRTVLACSHVVGADHPIVFNSVRIAGDRASISYSVLGRN